MQKKKSGFNHLFTETRLGWLIIFLIASYVGMGLIAYGLKGNWKFFQGSTLQTMCCQIPEIGILAIAVMLPMITDPALCERVKKIYEKLELPVSLNFDIAAAMRALTHDKKSVSQGIQVTTVDCPGSYRSQALAPEAFYELFDMIKEG